MNYKRIYYNIMENAKNRCLPANIYTEKHHMTPKCMQGGNGNNIVVLTAREHYIAHWLLVKMYPNEWKLYYAFFQMTKSYKHNRNINSRQFETARKALSNGAKLRYALGLYPRKTLAGRKILSQKMIGDNNPMRKNPEKNHTARPHTVFFNDGTIKHYEYGKLGYMDIGMSRSSWIVAVRKGIPVPKFNVKKIIKDNYEFSSCQRTTS